MPSLTPRTLELLAAVFPEEERKEAEEILRRAKLYDVLELERQHIAALKCSQGRVWLLTRALELGKRDYRDLLMAADFGHDTQAHLKWKP